MKRVLVVTKSAKNARVLYDQLTRLLGKFIQFDCVALAEGYPESLSCDVAVAATQELANDIGKHLKKKTEILVVRRTLPKGEWQKIMALPQGTKALLVNSSQEVAIQTVALLYEMGASHIEMSPFSPSTEGHEHPPVDIAITPNEEALVPADIKNVLNVGDRVVDSSTIFELLEKLNLLTEETRNIVVDNMANTIPLNPGLLRVLTEVSGMNDCLELALNMMDQAVLYLDAEYRVQIVNQQAETMFRGKSLQHIHDHTLGELLPADILERIKSGCSIKDEVVVINQLHYLMNRHMLRNKRKTVGCVLTFRECKRVENQTMKFYQALVKRGHIAKYSFDNILGKSPEILKAITFAKKNAENDNDTLIEGESGTGKELFAQAIHHSSPRSSGPFVAFNCATLNGPLLESELFGYEQGAFTGARAGGKPGLFELANKGTIFLDEIAEISIETQAKLLRVLQEREIVRIGDTKIIPIDIRVIAATNHNLYSLVKEKKFRSDLYFRLNVLSLSVPPLRNRSGDIPYLADYYLKKNNRSLELPPEILSIFIQYPWPGNIRELKNCIEYMINMGEPFTLDSLPRHIIENGEALQNSHSGGDAQVPDELAIIGDPYETLAVLDVLRHCHESRQHVGRKGIALQLAAKNVFASEQTVRTIIDRLVTLGFVYRSRGRKGTKITGKGLQVLRTLQLK